MRTNPFARDAGLLTEEEMIYYDKIAIETIRYELQARKIFDVKNIGQGGGAYVYRYYTETDPSEAAITMTGKAASADHPEKAPHDVDLPEISKEFFLNHRDIAAGRRQGAPLIDDCVRTATRKVAEAEDKLLISGEYTGWAALGLEGLFGATGRTNTASVGAWPANAFTDINAARAALRALGYVTNINPVLVGPSAVITQLDDLIANTGMTYRQALLDNNLVSKIIETPNAFAQDGGQDSVVLVDPSPGNFWAVQDMPLEVHLWYDQAQNVYGTVRETIAPVIGRPESIVEINTIV